MSTQITWADMVKLVEDLMPPPEGARSQTRLYRTLGNQALHELSERCDPPPRKVSWDNDTGGDLTVSDYSVELPIECIEVERVEWDGVDSPLAKCTEQQLDVIYPGWRDDTGDPVAYAISGNDLVLSSAPSGTTTGKLIVRGRAYLPDFSDDPNDENPLAYLPAGIQLVPAYFILANLPVIAATPQNASPEASYYAQALTKRRYDTQARYQKMWEKGLADASALMNRRSRLPFSLADEYG